MGSETLVDGCFTYAELLARAPAGEAAEWIRRALKRFLASTASGFFRSTRDVAELMLGAYMRGYERGATTVDPIISERAAANAVDAERYLVEATVARDGIARAEDDGAAALARAQREAKDLRDELAAHEAHRRELVALADERLGIALEEQARAERAESEVAATKKALIETVGRLDDMNDAVEAAMPELREHRGLRREVRAFALLMEQKLRENDYKGGWGECELPWLLGRLRQEVDELGAVAQARPPMGPEQVGREAADVGNFAMMIADVCGALPRVAREETEGC